MENQGVFEVIDSFAIRRRTSDPIDCGLRRRCNKPLHGSKCEFRVFAYYN